MKVSSGKWALLAIVSLSLAAICFAAPIAKPRTSSAKFTFVAYGDTRSDPAAHKRIIALIVRQKPEFVVQTGDLVDHGGSSAEWDEFRKITQPLRDAHIAYYPARGNHDIGPYYIRYVPAIWSSGNGLYYAFTQHNIRFIMVDCFESFSHTSAQFKWLEGELAGSKAKGIFTIVSFHEPPFSIGPHGDNFEVQRELHPLFVRYHVPLVFCGHDHLYYHTKRDGVVYVVTGGGGAPLYPPVNTQYAIPGDVYKTTYHIVRCDVTGNTIQCTAITPDNQVIDRFTVAGGHP